MDLKLPGQNGIKIASIFFDDPVLVTDARNGEILYQHHKHGDGDGFAAILYDADTNAPSSIMIHNDDPRGRQYALVAINIPVSGDGQAPAGGGSTGINESRNKGQTLHSGEQLLRNQYLESPNRKYRCYFQGDGNLVLRRTSDMKSLWSSRSHGRGGARLKMQRDGNLVIYTSSNSAIWSTKTHRSGAKKFVIKDYGVVKIESSSGRDIRVYP